MERLSNEPKPKIEPLRNGQGNTYAFKVYGKHPELLSILQNQIIFAQNDPLHQRQIEVIPTPSGSSNIYSNERLNKPMHSTKLGRLKLTLEIAKQTSSSSVVLFDDLVDRSANKVLSWCQDEINSLSPRIPELNEIELRMTTRDQAVFERVFHKTKLDPDRWAEEEI